MPEVYCPGPQTGGASVHELDPAGDVYPGAHALQLTLPATLENILAGHTAGAVAPATETKDPGGAGTHVAFNPPLE